MPNMSYCRFENTAQDIADCIESLEQYDWNLEYMVEEASSEYEARAMKRFVKLCIKVCESIND